ncbi:hypothetical protein [Nocardioides sp.]|uniref:hypothetical protein n=1 Tax=Nocardioides sp. TaxID=35761 RepID=UPI00286A12DF|nr:hypothetical protein [Nocardioides sp.]
MLSHLAPPVLVEAVQRWAVESQHRARRNAMLATTDCVQRRIERESVEDFFSERYPSRYPARRPAEQPRDAVRPDTLRRSQG